MSAIRSGRRPRSSTSGQATFRSAGGEIDESRRRDELLEILPGQHFVSGSAELDETDMPGLAGAPDVADVDTGGEDSLVQVIPRRADEFVCSRCFLIQHRTRLASSNGEQICVDCG